MSGEIIYNGHTMDEFVPRRSAAYVSQHDLHMGELTVRETVNFSAKCQGIGHRFGKNWKKKGEFKTHHSIIFHYITLIFYNMIRPANGAIKERKGRKYQTGSRNRYLLEGAVQLLHFIE
jgi:hypothetical protein